VLPWLAATNHPMIRPDVSGSGQVMKAMPEDSFQLQRVRKAFMDRLIHSLAMVC
jgi:hypothetical protein